MELWDTIITFAIVAAAAFYVFRRFSRSKKSGGGCGCGSESGCGGSESGGHSSDCEGQHH